MKKNVPVGVFGLLLGFVLNISPLPSFMRQILAVVLCIVFGLLLFKLEHKKEMNAGERKNT